MDDISQTEDELLAYDVSDEALETAAGAGSNIADIQSAADAN
jgi:hypothetical protein